MSEGISRLMSSGSSHIMRCDSSKVNEARREAIISKIYYTKMNVYSE